MQLTLNPALAFRNMNIWAAWVTLVFLAPTLGDSSVRLYTFLWLNTQHNNTLLVSPGWPAPSLVTCAVSCLAVAETCSSFVYDEVTSVCAPGELVLGSVASVLLPVGSLYSSVICPKPGYTLHRRQDTVICLLMSTRRLNYTNALRACSGNGAHLVTIKTTEKLELFKDAMRSVTTQMWIGLDDMEKEGIYRWVDDRKRLLPDLLELLFSPGQPDNGFGLEDCAAFDPGFYPINDKECHDELRYLCEDTPITLGTHYHVFESHILN